MARTGTRGRNKAEATVETDTDTDTDTDTAQEGIVSTDTDTITTDVTDTDQGESVADQAADESVPADLTQFIATVAEAIETADDVTGEVPVGQVHRVGSEYSKLDRRGKAAARKMLTDAMADNMKEGSVFGAKSYFELSEGLPTGTQASTKAPRVPADPTAAFVQTLVTANLAYNAVLLQRPAGVDDAAVQAAGERVTELDGQLRSYLDWNDANKDTRGDAPEVAVEVVAAVKGKVARSATRATGTRTVEYVGPRRSVANHIRSAFADLSVGGVLTVSQITAHRSAEYGDDRPSAGAVSARLTPASTVEGIETVEQDGHKAARKVA